MRPLIGSVYFGLARFSSAGEPVAEASVGVGKKNMGVDGRNEALTLGKQRTESGEQKSGATPQLNHRDAKDTEIARTTTYSPKELARVDSFSAFALRWT